MEEPKTVTFTGEMDGPFVWGRARKPMPLPTGLRKPTASRPETKPRLQRTSYFDAPDTRFGWQPGCGQPGRTAGTATAVVKGWPIRHLDKSDGVVKVGGREIQDWTRPLMRPELDGAKRPTSRFEGIENIPERGSCPCCVQPPLLFRPDGHGPCHRQGGAKHSWPRKKGSLRRTDRRPAASKRSAAIQGRTGIRLKRTAPSSQQRHCAEARS